MTEKLLQLSKLLDKIPLSSLKIAGLILIILFIVKLIKQKINNHQCKKRKKKRSKKKTLSSKQKGQIGEEEICKVLNQFSGYKKLILNAYLPKKNNRTTEVDIIMLHETGIYILESKNYSGWIFGDENQIQWCQLFSSARKYYFYNPISQNKGHIDAVQAILPKTRKKHKFRSLIVFGANATLKNIAISSKNVWVIKIDDLLKTCNRLARGNRIYSKREINTMYRILQKYTKASRKTKRRHIHDVKEYQKKLG